MNNRQVIAIMLFAPAIMAPLLWPRWGIVLGGALMTIAFLLIARRK